MKFLCGKSSDTLLSSPTSSKTIIWNEFLLNYTESDKGILYCDSLWYPSNSSCKCNNTFLNTKINAKRGFERKVFCPSMFFRILWRNKNFKDVLSIIQSNDLLNIQIYILLFMRCVKARKLKQLKVLLFIKKNGFSSIRKRNLQLFYDI